ncbi:hypothetical protein D554_0305 [Bordetella holmesii 30539]|uniref:Uncharacterized protein n=2 Tax=Bordetella holmesii TaxID=35814 RepID=A0A158M1B9_9BORD|nr:hypothetical protein D556_0807 [Bordetella holmesii 41130]EWM46043.1 hypothetical protein D555_0816 [Bordetella holmesii 35009]EWM50194.1 hypothetical protein D557_0037 [Bordetella holmesii 70147]EXF89107.1 hypothetical protein D554_0305 [Bordetella holmesii 30539]EXX95312.1 hypothetical protein D559_2748 [Bordetella holmesii 1058]KAK81707.1 hypothetical protein L573_0748 [Bordetella holmesii H620]KAK83101.1 hypothetical protein L503_2487 [Bordetella holmesii CDC-H809-BH]KAK86666.1 hypoth
MILICKLIFSILRGAHATTMPHLPPRIPNPPSGIPAATP